MNVGFLDDTEVRGDRSPKAPRRPESPCVDNGLQNDRGSSLGRQARRHTPLAKSRVETEGHERLSSRAPPTSLTAQVIQSQPGITQAPQIIPQHPQVHRLSIRCQGRATWCVPQQIIHAVEGHPLFNRVVVNVEPSEWKFTRRSEMPAAPPTRFNASLGGAAYSTCDWHAIV